MSQRKNNNRHSQRSEPTSLKSAIDNMLDTYKLKQQFNETEVLDSWESIMGKTVASRTTKKFVNNKKLFIEVSSAPLKHELSLSKQKILALLSEKFGAGAIEDIVFM